MRQTTLAFSTKAKKEEAEEEETDVSTKGSKADKGTMRWSYELFPSGLISWTRFQKASSISRQEIRSRICTY